MSTTCNLLKKFDSSVTMTDEEVRLLIEDIMKRHEAKSYILKHKYKITEGKDGRWFTRVPDKNGSRVVVFREREALDEFLIDYYKSLEEGPTLKDIFEESQLEKFREGSISESTLTRNRTDFNRFYSEFGEMKIGDVTTEILIEFIRDTKVELNLNAKAYGNLMTITRSIFKYARKKKLTDISMAAVSEELEWGKNAFRRYEKPEESQVFNDEEVAALAAYFKRKKDARYLGLLLLFVTGIRVGELAGLKWEDIYDGGIQIRRTETIWTDANHKSHCEVISLTKTEAGARVVPIPTNAMWILEQAKEINPYSEYVFAKDGSRVRAGYFRNALYKACKDLGIRKRSPHKIRKTYASILLDNDVAPKAIIENMGHTDISTTNVSYAKRRKAIKQRVEIVDAIPEFAPVTSCNTN